MGTWNQQNNQISSSLAKINVSSLWRRSSFSFWKRANFRLQILILRHDMEISQFSWNQKWFQVSSLSVFVKLTRFQGGFKWFWWFFFFCAKFHGSKIAVFWPKFTISRVSTPSSKHKKKMLLSVKKHNIPQNKTKS